ncbi:MAG TPA: biotin carboxylase N-terminal domain-containing protein [Candidatus Limnocylindrales bacterium]|nr:biotin carboxylase N-terminal domain-containing protein [Candidatus Limnocylindrales bacterium]
MTSPPRPVEATPAGTASLRKDGPPFERILVANRGEIAVRIMRACRELGIATVAVFSDADADGGHVRAADEAIRLGPAPPTESYLRADLIVEAARRTGAQAIHPGYGFLAERASFAAAVEEAGLVFIGPNADAIARLGDKLAARRLAAGVGVPVVPGMLEPAAIDRPDAIDGILAEADRIGFPLLVKTSAGGGGRGMRRVESGANLIEALAAGSAEAASAFGDGSVYLERVIEPARHIEVQLLGDAAGTIVAIGERDCSLQRRHQKLVEESPASGLTDDERARIHEFAVRVAGAAALRNASTAEFLFDRDRRFWFLEVNTRLQVEHGVSELAAGVDLVREQILVAAGRPLSSAVLAAAAEAARPVRHAIEVRISAEDPIRAFAPEPGRIGRWSLPSGPGVRVDTAVEAGDRVPPDYDPLIAKLLVVDDDRDAAIDRLTRALDEVEVTGIQTTLPFHRFVARHAGFRAGDVATSWVDEEWEPRAATDRHAALAVAAQAAAAVAVGEVRPAGAVGGVAAANTPPGRDTPSWRLAGRADAIDRWPR